MNEAAMRQMRIVSVRNLILGGQRTVQHLRSLEKNAQAANDNLLREILHRNAHTEYGKKYGFDQIRTYADFTARVPLTDYHDYEDYLRRMSDEGEKNVLTAMHPDYYFLSSGTTGYAKRIPCTGEQTKVIRTYLNLYRYGLASETVGDIWTDGATLSSVDVRLSHSGDGTPMGYFSSKALYEQGEMRRLGSLSPDEVIFSDPGEDCQYLHLLFALLREDVTEMNAAYITALLEMFRFLEENWRLLIADIRSGTINPDITLSPEKRQKLEAQLKPNPERADMLEKEFEKGFDDPILPRIWPRLALINAACGAAFAPYMKQFKRYLGDDIPALYYGYTASEAIMAVPYCLNSPEFVLLPDSCFFEFQPYDEEKDEIPPEWADKTLRMEQLEKGKTYTVIVTTHSGFYRYRMHDVIIIKDFHGTLPVMEFMYREHALLSIAGEKLTEKELSDALFKAMEEEGVGVTGFSVYTDPDVKPRGRYVFLVEPSREDHLPDPVKLGERIFDILDEANVMVHISRDEGWLSAPEVRYLKDGTYDRYRLWRGNIGLGGNQIKPPQILRTPEMIGFFLKEVL